MFHVPMLSTGTGTSVLTKKRLPSSSTKALPVFARRVRSDSERGNDVIGKVEADLEWNGAVSTAAAGSIGTQRRIGLGDEVEQLEDHRAIGVREGLCSREHSAQHRIARPGR